MASKAKRVGRPRKSGYTPEIGDRIIALMCEGKSLRNIAAVPGMPPMQTISDWGREAKYSDQEFVGRYARARISGCHAQFEQMREIEDKLLNEEFDDPQNARIALDTNKWRLSKMLPGVYGERTHIEHSGMIKHETVKDHAPEWMQERLVAPAAQVAEAETVH